MNKEEILEKIKEHLAKETGEKSGGSGHLSFVSISDITIDEIEETIKDREKLLRVSYSYRVDIESEFTLAEEHDPEKEPDPFDPYHYRKKDEMIISI